jgi:hypothetical protein
MSVENKPEIKSEIDPEVKHYNKQEIKTDLSKTTSNPEQKMDKKIIFNEIKKKKFSSFSRFININTIKRIIRQNLFCGLIYGYALSYYLNEYQIVTYVKTKHNLLKEEINSLEKEIKDIKVNKGIADIQK